MTQHVAHRASDEIASLRAELDQAMGLYGEMLAALKAARAYIADLADDFIRCNSLLNSDLDPVPGTMDADAQAIADEERALLEAIDAAIAKAEGGQ